jgi:multimeric flavodoxin WrbA
MKTEIIELAGQTIQGCRDCAYCKRHFHCQQEDDFNTLIPILNDPEVKAIIIGTPVYLGTMTSQCKAFLDRSVLFRRNDFVFRNKVGAVLAVGGVRNGGQELTIQAVQAALMCHDMICVGDGLDTCHFGGTMFSGDPKGLDMDTFGRRTAQNLGKRVAQVVGLLYPSPQSSEEMMK